ncbi:unnamed protein product [Caenorhabditis brenneri]
MQLMFIIQIVLISFLSVVARYFWSEVLIGLRSGFGQKVFIKLWPDLGRLYHKSEPPSGQRPTRSWPTSDQELPATTELVIIPSPIRMSIKCTQLAQQVLLVRSYSRRLGEVSPF